jgi:hypothetical protein
MLHITKKLFYIAFIAVLLGNNPAQAQLFAGSPLRGISNINTQDANGIGDSLNVLCQITGVVTSPDFTSSASLGFSIQDTITGAGIIIFTPTGAPNFGYVPLLGDYINVRGKVIQDKGLMFFQADDLAKRGVRPLPSIIPVNNLNNTTEGKLVALNNLTLINPGQWPSTLGNPDRIVYALHGTDTIEIVIDADTDIHGTTAPVGSFNLVGIGSQRDFTFPYTSSFRILPRFTGDVRTGFGVGTQDISQKSNFVLYPNPFTQNIQINAQTTEPYTLQIYNALGQKIIDETHIGNANIAVSSTEKGLYIVKIIQSKAVTTYKIMGE